MSQVRNRKRRSRPTSPVASSRSSPEQDKYRKRSAAQAQPYNAWPFTFILLIILALIAYNGKQFHLPSITGSMSSNKPYATIEAYYPYYLSEHKDPNCQRAHFFGTTIVTLIALIKPELAITGMIGVLAGYISFPVCRGMDNGALEAVVLVTTLLFVAHLHGVKKYLPLIAFVGYGAAWFGHFYFENNKPATFIYPSYSAICDFKLIGAFYRQLLSTNNWELLWEKGIDFADALGATVIP